MPAGKPVSTMAPNNAHNAGIEAAKILAASDESLKDRLRKMTKNLELEVVKKDALMQKIGPHEYLRLMKAGDLNNFLREQGR